MLKADFQWIGMRRFTVTPAPSTGQALSISLWRPLRNFRPAVLGVPPSPWPSLPGERETVTGPTCFRALSQSYAKVPGGRRDILALASSNARVSCGREIVDEGDCSSNRSIAIFPKALRRAFLGVPLACAAYR